MFEKAYDLLMADVDYERIYQLIKPYIKPTDLIIDAGCGSGYLLVEFLKNKRHIIGIDKNTSMLSLAYEKMSNHGFSTKLYEHDIRDPFKAKVDVIIAMFDVLNYFKGVKKVFRNIYHALDQDGRFIFDIYKYECLEIYNGYEESDETPINYHWKIKTYKHQMIHDVSVFQSKTQVKQYIYPLDYYTSLLTSIGFSYTLIEGPDERKHVMVCYK